MKKNKILLLGLLVAPLLSSCTETIVYPKRSYPAEGDPIENKEINEEYNMRVYFFLDYSHSIDPEKEDLEKLDADYVQNDPSKPIYVMQWYMLKPLGEEPAEAKARLQAASSEHDPLYPKFIGWSEYSSSVDESKLWNFETDYKQSNILRLYAIWVSEGGAA